MIGTKAFGLRLPIIKEGDNLVDIIYQQISKVYLKREYIPEDGDIIGITESIVARAQGNYCTIDDICEDLQNKGFTKNHCYIFNPIFSRNRFSIILKAFARYFDKITIVAKSIDEVGNLVEHPITKVNYKDFYKETVEGEQCEFEWIDRIQMTGFKIQMIDCSLHDLPETQSLKESLGIKNHLQYEHFAKLDDIMSNKCEFGLLGSNKATEISLKLFPNVASATDTINKLQRMIRSKIGVDVNIMLYGDGAYKDPSGIWELADPVVSPVYTDGLKGSPNELKLKYLADNDYKNLKGEELTKKIREQISHKQVQQGQMETQGTTPRKYVDLLGSLMDLISGSGDKGTPVVIVQDYFKNYSN